MWLATTISSPDNTTLLEPAGPLASADGTRLIAYMDNGNGGQGQQQQQQQQKQRCRKIQRLLLRIRSPRCSEAVGCSNRFRASSHGKHPVKRSDTLNKSISFILSKTALRLAVVSFSTPFHAARRPMPNEARQWSPPSPYLSPVQRANR